MCPGPPRAAQMPAALKRARSDHVLDNVGTRDDLADAVARLWAALERRAAAGAATTANAASAATAASRTPADASLTPPAAGT